MIAAVRRFLRRLLNFLRPSRAEPDLDREIAAHLALLEDDFARRGLPPDAARRAARRAFGGVDQTREMHRDARSFAWLDDMARDLRYAARTLARTPGFTVAAVLTLGIGIGGSTAVFSLFHAVLLRPLPFPDADQVVLVFEDSSTLGFPTNDIRPRDYAAWAADNDTFVSLAGVTDHSAILGGGDEPERVTGRRVTRSFFSVLGSQPVVGRVFTEDEDQPGGPRVAVLSYRFWLRRFGADPAVVGRDIVLNDERHTVVGVMPREFQFLENYVSYWVPAAFSSDELSQRRPLRHARWPPEASRRRRWRSREPRHHRRTPRALWDPRDAGAKPARTVVVPFGERVVRRRPPSARRAARRRRHRPARRLRQPGEPAAGPRRGAQPRDRATRRARRLARSDRPPVADRKRRAGVDGPDRRRGAGAVVVCRFSNSSCRRA